MNCIANRLPNTLWAAMAVIAILSSGCVNKQPNASELPASAVAPTEADLGDLYKYYHSDPQTLDQKDENELIEYAADRNIEAIRTQSGVYIQEHLKGDGEQVKWGDPIAVDYKGYFLDGEQFDSSYDRGEPIKFRVGSMVAAWNEALPYLTRGSKATLLVPSHMGYGPKGFPGFIGPNRNIIFDVHVLDDEAIEK